MKRLFALMLLTRAAVTFTAAQTNNKRAFVKDDTGKVVRLDYVLPNGQKVQLKKIK